MKRLLLALVVLAMFLPVMAISAEPDCYPSGLKDADALIYTGQGTLCSITITTDGTNQCAVLFYDGLTATGTALTTNLTCPGASTGSGPNTCIFGGMNLGYITGLYADMTKAGGTCSFNVGRRSRR
jgi:hypothetical protein